MKRKVLPLLLALCMIMMLIPITSLADNETVDGAFVEVTIDGTTTQYSNQTEFMTALQNAENKTIYVKLLKDIEQISGVITVKAGQTVILDMNGKSITTTTTFTGRPIVNEGTLTVTGNGTIDSSMSENGGYGAINNKGTLTIENGTYRGALYASGSSIRNTGDDAKLMIKDGTFDGAICAVYNEGTATIDGGTFISKSCSACAKADGHEGCWSYTIRNSSVQSHMVINGGTFIGTQGAVSAGIGYLEVNDGEFKTVDCEQKHGAIFYALYAAGEYGKVKCVINGGTFETVGKYATVLIGNDNTNGDGGINAEAAATVTGGQFIAPEGVPALKGAQKTGDPTITGGIFSSDVSEYVPNGNTMLKTEAGYEIVEGTSDESVTDGVAVAKIGTTYYGTLSAAINFARANDTVTLVSDVTEAITIGENQTITLDLNGKTLKDNTTAGNSNDRKHTITNNGILTIVDSSESQTGTVDNVSHARGAIYNNSGAICTIKSGTITRSAEAGASATDSGNNSWYVIKNDGTMTFDGGTVSANGKFSSLVRNDGVMTINDGLFTNCFIAIKNDSGTQLTIKGGTIKSEQQAIQNWTNATIEGGDLTGAVWSISYDESSPGKTEITGTANITGDVVSIRYDDATETPSVTVNGGTIIGSLQKATYSSSLVISDPSATTSQIIVKNGQFSESVNEAFLDSNLNAELYSTTKNSGAPYSYYENVSAALVAAQAGDTVKDLSKAGETEPGNTVTLNYNNGSTSNVTVKVRSNETITLPTPTLDGYTFLYWQDATGKTYNAGDTFTVSDSTTLTAQWSYNGGSSSHSGGGSSSSSTSTVSVDTAKNGTVTVSPKSASKGTTVTITAKPDKGYEVDEVVVTDKNGKAVKVTDKGNNKYTFTMPSGKVDVEVTFVKEYVAPAIGFDDVSKNAWYYDAAIYAAENGLMSGTGNSQFSPDMTTSRAMIWTTLARLDGQNVAVQYGNWYDKAQSWAVARGVSDGTNPDNAITREQLAVMLYGFAKDQGYTTKNGVSLNRYTDASDVSPWAAEALEWAVGNGLISSMGNNILAPTGTATRAQVAVILMNFCENIAK